MFDGRRAALCLLVALGAACSEVPASNPYDPRTSASQRAPARVQGTLALPDGFEPGRLLEATVELVSATDPEDRRTASIETPDAETGAAAFGFVDVPSGLYVLSASLSGFGRVERVLDLPIGGAIDVGRVDLVAAEEDLGAVRVRATRAGQADGRHAGILVQAVDTPESAVTDPDGVARLVLPPGRYTLTARYEGYADGRLEDVDVRAGDEVDAGAMVLEGEPGAIAGALRMPAGFAADRLADARVELHLVDADEAPAVASPGPDGRFRFEAVDAADYEVVPVLEGFLAPTTRVRVPVGERIEVGTLSFERDRALPAFVAGLARFDGAERHDGIRIESRGTPYWTETTADGAFLLEVGPGMHTLEFTADGYGVVSREVGPLEPLDAMELQEAVLLMGEPASVAGAVGLPPDYADRGAVERVVATLTPAGAQDDPEATRIAAVALDPLEPIVRYRFDAVPPGPWILRLRLEGFEDHAAPVQVRVGRHTEVPYVQLAPLPPVAWIEGVAQLLGSVDHAGIAVELEGTPLTEVTNSAGAFEIQVPANPLGYRLVFRRPGYSVGAVEVGPLAAEARIELDEPVVLVGQPGSIEGLIRLDEGFDPRRLFPDVVVRLLVVEDGAVRQVDQQVPLLGADPADGATFLFRDVAPGNYVVDVQLDGFSTAPRSPSVLPGAAVSLGILRLSPTGPRESFLRGEARVPCPAPPCDHGGIRVEAAGHAYVTQTNSEGDYELQVPAGEYFLLFTRAGYDGADRGPISVERQESTDVEPVTLTVAEAFVSGRVRRPDPLGGFEDVPNADVALFPLVGDLEGEDAVEPVARARAGDDGRFSVGGVVAGTYRLRVSLESHTPAVRVVQLVPDDTVEVGSINIDVHRGAVAGTVRRDGAPPGAVTVQAVRAGGPPELSPRRRTLVTEPGSDAFRMDGLAVGRWSIMAAAEGYVPTAARELDVGVGEVVDFDADLRPRVATLAAPALVAEPEITVTLQGDYQHYRVWVGGAPEPDGWTLLPGDGRVADVVLPAEGTHEIRARLATDAFVQGRDPLLQATSAPLVGRVTYDATAPEVIGLRAGDGFHTDAGPIDLEVVCADALHPSEALTLAIDVDGVARPPVRWRARVEVPLGGAPARRTVGVRCVDPAGNESERATVDVIHDTEPPTVRAFAIRGEDEGDSIRDPVLTVTLEVDDDLAGAVASALADAPQDCADARYDDPAEGEFPFVLGPGDGARSLFVCVQDAAGNRTAAAIESNALQLDTQAPNEPVVRPAPDADRSRGAPEVRARQVELEVDLPEPGLTLLIEGDLEAAGAFEPPPADVTLTDGDGAKTLRFVVRDAAGNTSEPILRTVVLDREAPDDGVVTLAEGRVTVNDRQVGVTIRDTAPDSMRFWEVAAGAECGAASCGDAGFAPFSPITAITLSEALGAKRVCWAFCDLAGNRSAVGSAVIDLGTFLPRPRPTLSSIAPRQIQALSSRDVPPSYPIIVEGVGLPADALLQVGDFTVTCVAAGAAACRADADGGCRADGACAQSCATTCVADLADLGELVVGRAGSYPVRLVTPLPVVGGDGASERALILDVVAPIPSIDHVSARGFVQSLVDGQPDPEGFVELDVEASGVLDNTTWRLGPNQATVLTEARDPGDPGRRALRLRVPTLGLFPDDPALTVFAAENPSPGGGAAQIAFGINRATTPCPVGQPCLSALPRTRAPRTGDGVLQAFERPALQGFAGRLIEGATAVATRGVGGALRGRVEASSPTLVVPPALSDTQSLVLEDARGTGPNVRMREVYATGTRAFDLDGATRVELGRVARVGELRMTRARVLDVNGDGHLDVVAPNPESNTITIARGDGAGAFARETLAAETSPVGVAVADLDGDGHLDLASVGGADFGDPQLSIRLGRGGGAFGLRSAQVAENQSYAGAQAADLDGDGAADLVLTWFSRGDVLVTIRWSDGRSETFVMPGANRYHLGIADLDADGHLDLYSGLSVALGDGRGGFTILEGAFEGDDWPSTTRPPEDSAVGDLDGDGAPDVVVVGGVAPNRTGGEVRVYFGRGDGTFRAPRVLGRTGANGVELADLDGDAWLDIVVSTGQALELVVYWGDGDAAYATAQTLDLSPPLRPEIDEEERLVGVRVADFDEDGALDLFAVLERDGYLIRGVPTPRYGGPQRDLGPVELDRLFPADLDGDGDLDVLVLSGTTDVGSYLNEGDAFVFGPHRLYAFGSGGFGDVTGSGRPDLVVERRDQGNQALPEIRVFTLNVNDALVDAGELDVGFRPDGVGVADVDEDGAADLITRDVDTGEGVVLFGDGAGAFPQAVRIPGSPGGLVTAHDVDGDGRLDLVLAGAREWGVAFQTAPRQFAPLALGPLLANATVAVADFDGDGRAEAVAMRAVQRRVEHYEFGDDGAPLRTYAGDAPSEIRGLLAADLDRDGDVDLVAASSGEDAALVFANRGDFTFAEPLRLSVPGASAPALFDIDGDGVDELVVGGERLRAFELPTDAAWMQTLREPALATVPLPAGASAHTVSQAGQMIDHLAVRVRIAGEGLDGLSLRLRAPSGDEVDLGQGPDADRWPGHFVVDAAGLMGPQPSGDWTLLVHNDGAAAALEDFAVITHGWTFVPRP